MGRAKSSTRPPTHGYGRKVRLFKRKAEEGEEVGDEVQAGNHDDRRREDRSPES